MKRTIDRTSRARWAAAISFGIALAVSLTNFTGDGSGLAQAGVAVWFYDIKAVTEFPIAGSHYRSTGAIGFPTLTESGQTPEISVREWGAPINLPSVPLPPPGSSAIVDSFFDVFVELDFFAPASLPF